MFGRKTLRYRAGGPQFRHRNTAFHNQHDVAAGDLIDDRAGPMVQLADV